jgi:hypothetical protein
MKANRSVSTKSAGDQALPPQEFRELLEPELRNAFRPYWVGPKGYWCLCCGYICETVNKLRRSSAEDYNRQYRESKVECDKALAKKDFFEFVFLHDWTHQVEALKGLMLRLPAAQYGRLVRRVWTESNDVLWTSMREWTDLFLSLSEVSRRQFMTQQDQKVFDALPEKFHVYRGYYPNLNEGGMSWSLDREIAVGYGPKDARVRSKTIQKSDVLGYTNARNDKEIILQAEG